MGQFGRWMRDHPHILERAYASTLKLFAVFEPLIQRVGTEQVDRALRRPEELSKKVLFDCKMCGQCVLHATAMTCPMTCPKNLRNGPCGGVRADGNCEVEPEMRCVWVEAYERSQHMPLYGAEIMDIPAPLDRQLEGTSAWINQLTGRDKQTPPGWIELSAISILPHE